MRVLYVCFIKYKLWSFSKISNCRLLSCNFSCCFLLFTDPKKLSEPSFFVIRRSPGPWFTAFVKAEAVVFLSSDACNLCLSAVRPPPLNWTVTKSGKTFQIRWIPPSVLSLTQWKFLINLTECGETKVRHVCISAHSRDFLFYSESDMPCVYCRILGFKHRRPMCWVWSVSAPTAWRSELRAVRGIP